VTLENPLLDSNRLPRFEEIRAEAVRPAVRQLLGQARAAIEKIASGPAPPSYESTVLPLDRATEPLDETMALVRHLEAVRSEPALREALHAVEAEVSAFYSSIPLHEGLWNAVQQVTLAPPGVHRRFLEKTQRGFRRAGADLPPPAKQQLQAIDVELTQLTTAFGEAVLDATNAWEMVLTAQQTAGLPESAKAAARQSAAAKGRDGWRITLQAPSYHAVLTYLDDRSIREAAWRAYHRRGADPPFDNRERLVRILELRRQKAALLGYANFADFVLEERMARSSAAALAFLEDLAAKTKASFDAETAELAAFSGGPLEPWDVAYWAEKLRQQRYGFDEEQLRPYFPLDRVLSGLFDICRDLFGVHIQPLDAPVWDPAVQCFEIRMGDGRQAGIFYTDWFPRENKRGGAWMDCLRTGGPLPFPDPAASGGDAGFEPHIALMCGNLTPPLDGRPALLTHAEVTTIFHEFGHLLHQCLSTVPIRSLAGTHVAWDFVELPSQLMENWCWERAALDRFARHWETGEAIPASLFDCLQQARNFRSASAQMRQLSLGLTDLYLHMNYDPARDGDVIAYARELMQPMSPAALPADYALIAAFTHLFADPVGYGAGYYSYKWAEVLDADAFTRFAREGLFHPQVGAEFRDRILARGDAEDPAELFRSFMGRDPDPTALLVRQGLIAAGGASGPC